MKSVLNAPGTMLLQLRYDEPLSNYAYNFNLRRYKLAPLDLAHVKRVNAAEGEFWKRSAGSRCDWSDQILGFDCGGQQHVHEKAFRQGLMDSARHVIDTQFRTLVS